jgi:very-short-patch-repair endonuclease
VGIFSLLNRDEILAQTGYRILRIKNNELKDMAGVLIKIESLFLPSPTPPWA